MTTSLAFTHVPKKPGSTQQTINIDRNGEPFGQLWTWPSTKTERHPWHVKLLAGQHRTFRTLAEAKAYIGGLSVTTA